MSHSAPRLCVVSELYYPEETSTGYFMTGIAEGLTGSFDVRVLSGQSAYSGRGQVSPRHEVHNGVAIRRLATLRWNKDRLLGRAVNVVLFTAQVFLHLVFHLRRGDLLLVVTNPPTMPIVVGLAVRLRGARGVLLVHDVYPEILAAVGFLRPTSLAYRALARLFAAAFRHFDRVVVIGRDMQDVVFQKLGANRPPVSVIPNWGDCAEIVPSAPLANQFRATHGLMGKIILQFSGNIGRTHAIEAVLDLAEQLKADASFQILIVGYGGKQGFVAAEISRRALSNVMLLPRQPREQLSAMLCASDATIIAMVDGMYGLSVPSRLYNVMAAGVPVIALAHPGSELSLVVGENEAGWVVQPGDATTLLALAMALKTSEGEAEARRRGGNGRQAVSDHYTRDRIIADFRALLQAFGRKPLIDRVGQ